MPTNPGRRRPLGLYAAVVAIVVTGGYFAMRMTYQACWRCGQIVMKAGIGYMERTYGVPTHSTEFGPINALQHCTGHAVTPRRCSIICATGGWMFADSSQHDRAVTTGELQQIRQLFGLHRWREDTVAEWVRQDSVSDWHNNNIGGRCSAGIPWSLAAVRGLEPDTPASLHMDTALDCCINALAAGQLKCVTDIRELPVTATPQEISTSNCLDRNLTSYD